MIYEFNVQRLVAEINNVPVSTSLIVVLRRTIKEPHFKRHLGL